MILKECIKSYESFASFCEAVDIELNKLMGENPKFVYPDKPRVGCQYFKGPSSNTEKCSGCIFGQAFQRLGVTELGVPQVDIGKVFKRLHYKCPKEWKIMQLLQDNGVFWGVLRSTTDDILEIN